MADAITTNQAIATAALKPGEQTTEYAATQSASLWSTILMVAGLITTIVPPIIDSLKQIPTSTTNPTLTIIIAVCGILVTVAGALVKATTTSAYSTSRGLIKAAAVRDLDVTPPTSN
jgi:hypothetical protein